MSVLSIRTQTIVFSGDVSGTELVSAANNASSSGQVQIIALASGNNTITVPAAGTTPTAVTIVPAAGNTAALVLKGVNGDTGITIHKTDPTTIALDSSVSTFVINAASGVNVRFIWS